MPTGLRRLAVDLAESLIEGAHLAAALIGGAVGFFTAHQLAPVSWPEALRWTAAGTIAAIGAVLVAGLIESVLAAMRRRTNKVRTDHSAPGAETESAAPATIAEALAEATTATEIDAARNAAIAAYSLDCSDNYLRTKARWSGYETGEAAFVLGDGLVLHYRPVRHKYGTRDEFTVWSSDTDTPIPARGMEELRRHLADRAAGRPVTSPLEDARAAAELTV